MIPCQLSSLGQNAQSRTANFPLKHIEDAAELIKLNLTIRTQILYRKKKTQNTPLDFEGNWAVQWFLTGVHIIR